MMGTRIRRNQRGPGRSRSHPDRHPIPWEGLRSRNGWSWGAVGNVTGSRAHSLGILTRTRPRPRRRHAYTGTPDATGAQGAIPCRRASLHVILPFRLSS